MKFLSSYKDRHGKLRFRFRKDGRSFQICPPDAPDFADEYAACLASVQRMGAIHRPAKPELPLTTQARDYLASRRIEGGFVYFVHASSGRVKIGYTTNPLHRFGSITTNCPDRLTLLGMVAGSKADEKAWHQRFSDLHLFGEWFRSTEALKSAIRAAKTQEHLRTLSNQGVLVRQSEAA